MTPSDPFEEELRGLQPAPPPPRLATAVARALDHPADIIAVDARAPEPGRRRHARQVSLWLAWGVAACMTAALLHTRAQTARHLQGVEAPPAPGPVQETRTSTGDPAFQPVSTTNTLVGALDEGVVYLEDGRPARKVRYEFVDTVNLRAAGDPAATIKLSYPREEIRLVPLDAF